jgi:hypothetical protein
MPPSGAYALLAGAALFLVAGWAALRRKFIDEERKGEDNRARRAHHQPPPLFQRRARNTRPRPHSLSPTPSHTLLPPHTDREALEAAHAEWTAAPPPILAAVAVGAALAASGAATLAGALRPISPAANQK